MSSIKLNSSGGGSVSLSAADTSTDVTVKFPSGNSSAGQALVAGNTSGELDWETVPNSTAVPLLRLSTYNIPSSSDYLGSVFSRSLEWRNDSSTNFDTDTHSGWDATNYWYVVPQAGFYQVHHSFNVPNVAFVDSTKVHYVYSGIVHSLAANKAAWNNYYYINTIARRSGDPSFNSFNHTEIIKCAAGDAIKTSFLWDKGTDTNNTTTSVSPRRSGVTNTFMGQSLFIKYVRPL